MAKRLKRMRIMLDIDYVDNTDEIHECCYECDDSAVSGVTYTSLTGPNPAPGRAIAAGELTGTLQAFLDSLKSDIETQEGIV